jgi:hypothetical protein
MPEENKPESNSTEMAGPTLWTVRRSAQHVHRAEATVHRAVTVGAVDSSEQDEGTLKVGGKIVGGAKGRSFSYAVAVFDDATNETYSDDPKIIVGTGLEAARDEPASALERSKRSRGSIVG